MTTTEKKGDNNIGTRGVSRRLDWANVYRLCATSASRFWRCRSQPTSLGDDVAALTRYLDRASAPVVLVGHAYAGAVVSSIDDKRVRSEGSGGGSSSGERRNGSRCVLLGGAHPQAPQLAPDTHGFIWMPEEGFQNAFAQNAKAVKQKDPLGDSAADCTMACAFSGKCCHPHQLFERRAKLVFVAWQRIR